MFGVASIGLTVALAIVTLLLIDIYLHGKFQRSAGLNVWGYRGPVVSRKAPGEFRIVVLGGSTVFGYGVKWDESFPAALERKLAARTPRPFKVVNLGYNNEGAYSFA